MSLVGYPDFQEQAQWQSPPAVIGSYTVANGATKSFPDTGPIYFNVSNWNATQLRLNSDGALDVECIWYDAIPATAYLARSNFTIPAAGSGVVSLPNAGPYLQVNVTNLTGGSSGLTAVIAFTNRKQQPFILTTSGPILNVAAQIAAGGATVFNTSPYLYAGPASFLVSTSATTWIITLHGVTSNGTASIITEMSNAEALGGNYRRGNIVIPPQVLRARFINFDAGAQSYYCSVVPDMFR